MRELAPRHPPLRIVFRPLMSRKRAPRASDTAPRSPLPRLTARAAAVAALAALALGTAGCSVKGADNANVIVGKQQFVAKCGSCHTLARASTKKS